MQNISNKKPKLKYTQKKFLSQTLEKQHKECALLLKKIFNHHNPHDLWKTYLNWMSWMNLQPVTNNIKNIADAYHHHIHQTRISLKEHNLLPAIHTQDKIEASPPLNITIYLENIRSAHNVGSILRTTEALSLGIVIFGGMTPLPSHKQVQDTSMGAHEWVNWRQGDIASLPRPLIVLETSPDAIPIHDFLFPESFTLAIGNEEYGCSDALISQADVLITIPLFGRKNSLNVANAFAITAHEIRQSTL
ncbi:MAG: tRNA (guanosine(18)-2'-O)-methyltransferase [Chlamydiae bacterium]|nr:tRNA (guanosine(18)-2'-O)-methyltransferase [Chlamydiota bacterium]